MSASGRVWQKGLFVCDECYWADGHAYDCSRRSRFVICSVCRYHMAPEKTVDGKCINAARCEGRVIQRRRDKAAAGKRRR